MRKIILLFIITISSTYIFASNFNFLVNEQSPYLLRHSKNPVLWHPWNKNIFQKAKKENKLIFLSIGYSTCHWCRIMEKESFENDSIAKELNKNYLSIKIDREELPHLDIFYQDIFSKLKKRRNGWPLNLILNDKHEILYISTYIPNVRKYEVEGMNTLIPRIAKEYKNKNKRLLAKINLYKKNIILKEKIENSEKLKDNIDDKYISLLKKRYDKIYKGFDKQPKFPLFKDLNLLYDLSLLKNNDLGKESFFMFDSSLKAMANGGIFDQIEGGFFRYSVYPDWIIPHFEKMLYTQAEAIDIYTKAYINNKNPLFKDIVNRTIYFVNDTFKNKEQLFYSASDADSLSDDKKIIEGYYYTFDYDEINSLFKKEGFNNAEELLEYLGFDDFGNFNDSLNNVHIIEPNKKKPKNFSKAIKILKNVRQKKNKPFIDKKIITSWNALFIKSLYKASIINDKYLLQAEKSLESLLKNLYVNSILYHQKFNELKPKQKALLEDYSFVIDMLIEAYLSTYKKIYLDLAKKLAFESIDKFYKNKNWYMDEDKNYRGNFIDRYHISSISSFLHSLLSISNLTYDLKLLEKTKKYINEQENRILLSFVNHPEGLRLILRKNYGNIILKATKNKLQKNKHKISSIKYPFLLKKKEHSKYFLLCDEITCFAYDESLNKIIKIINK